MQLEAWKHLAEIIGLLAAAVFFVYKVLSGYLIMNLSLEVSSRREPIDNTDRDNLVITVTLSKGDRGSVLLHDGEARVRYGDQPPQVIQLIGFYRLAYVTKSLNDIKRKKIEWKTSQSKPLLRLTPGDKTTYEAHFQVPGKEVCEVEVTIVGKRSSSWRMGQWRCSLVSLPYRPETSSKV